MSGFRSALALALALAAVAGCSSGGDDGPPGNQVGTAAVGGGVIAPPGGGGGTTPVTPVPNAGTGGGVVAPGGSGGTGVVAAGGSGGASGTGAVAGEGGGGTMAVPPTGASWTMMGGDARNNYNNPSETKLSVANAPMLQELWTFTVSGYPPGSPLVVDGVVYVMSTGGTYAINLADGKQKWARMDINGTASLAYDNGFVYAHAAPATLYKLKASDGTTVWGPTKTYDHPNADGTSSPIVGGGKVLVGHSCGTAEIGDPSAAMTSHGGVFAADVETGMMAWHYWTTGAADSPENGAMVWSTVSIADGVVYAATGNNYTMAGTHSDAIHAIDLATGAQKWSKQVRTGDTWTLLGGATGEDTDFGANPIIADVGGKKIVAAGDKGSAFWALDRDTGNILWSRNDLSPSHFAANGGVLMNGAFDGSFFYVISNDPTGVKSMLHKLDPAMDGKDAVPAITYPKITWGAPSLANGLLVVPVDNEIVILNAATLAELKRFDTGGTIAAGAAAIVDGKIVVQSGLEYPLGAVTSNNQIRCYGLK